MWKNKIDLTNQKFGKLTVIKDRMHLGEFVRLIELIPMEITNLVIVGGLI